MIRDLTVLVRNSSLEPEVGSGSVLKVVLGLPIPSCPCPRINQIRQTEKVGLG